MSGDWKRAGSARLLAVALLLGVFSAGALTGAAANRLLEAREAGPVMTRDRFERSPPERTGTRVQFGRSPATMLEQRLDLSAEQVAEIESIFEGRRVRTEAILRDFQPRLQAQRDSADVEIRAVLTSEQAAEFDELVREGRGRGRDFRVTPGERRRGP
jgi:Spy/CpxP family protein refolding chaperone